MNPPVRDTRRQLLVQLSDGAFHSGESLGEALGISRGAIWKQIETLSALGLDIHRVSGRGYRLAQPLILLDAQRIRDELSADIARRVHAIHIFDSIDSTNAWLVEQDCPEEQIEICLAEHQSAGRGRRGRTWQSPFAACLYSSVSWPFPVLPPDFQTMSLVVAIAVQRALRRLGVPDVQLKWPNDIHAADAKLGGILLEVRGEPAGGCRVVIGVGLNVALPDTVRAAIDQPVTDIRQLTGALPDRNRLFAAMLNEFSTVFAEYSARGFAPFHAEWQSLDALSGKTVVLQDHEMKINGECRGVASDGALQIETPDGVQRFFVGDVSVRAQA